MAIFFINSDSSDGKKKIGLKIFESQLKQTNKQTPKLNNGTYMREMYM